MFCKWCGAKVDGPACGECGKRVGGAVEAGDLKRYLFMRPVLEAIAKGRFFRAVVAGVWRVGAVLLGIGGFFLWIVTWKLVFSLEGGGIIGGVFYQLFFLVALYMVIHTQWIRAGDVDALPDSEFTVIPIFSIALRCTGEIYAIIVTLLGIGGFFLLTFAGAAAGSILPRDLPFPFDMALGAGGGVVSGLILMGVAFVAAIGVLMLFYFLAEALVVLVQIARDTRSTREVAQQYDRYRAGAR
jgi:hypothetical protein